MSNIPVKNVNSKFTDDQWQAIFESGNSILVSASAGSGKTTILVRRIIEKIINHSNPTKIDELLVVTYTNAAAREMKERIQREIEQEINKSHDSNEVSMLLTQKNLVGNADISTIHSFCLKVIKRYYYLIDIDPVFRLLTDETEITLLKDEVLDNLFEEELENAEPVFTDLIDNFADDKNLDKVKELISNLYTFAMANPNPQAWLENLYTDENVTTLEETDLYLNHVRDQLASQLTYLVEELSYLADQAVGEDFIKQRELLEEYARKINEELLQALKDDRLEDLFVNMENFTWTRWKGKDKKNDTEEVAIEKDELTKQKDFLKKEVFEKFREQYFSTSYEKQVELLNKTQPLIKELARVTLKFKDQYFAKKLDENALDFNDLEHLTLQILKNDDGSPSEASKYYREKFNEVMVDEYQDINVLQEEILSYLSKDETEEAGNQFLVGDVKQSIYGFRLAAPNLFLEKYREFSQESNPNTLIILAENFRSRDTVVDFTNIIFRKLMDEDLGEMAYDTSAELVQGFKNFSDTGDFSTELLIYENDSDDEASNDIGLEESEDLDKNDGEITIVAKQIRDLVDSQKMIYDKSLGSDRPITYKDIVLLTPTRGQNLNIQNIFMENNIPLAMDNIENYFKTIEISTIMSLLKIIDNPRQDIPLVAVLRSMIVGLDEEDLARLRKLDKSTSFYDLLILCKEKYNPQTILYKKVSDFLDKLDEWRNLSNQISLVDLIWTLYIDTGFLDYVGGLLNGQQRQANLHALYERAATYEESSFKGLFQFIQFIEKMQKKDKDLAEPSIVTEDQDVVRVMTIHGSKGLEFPIVFVLNQSKNINLMEASRFKTDLIALEDEGIGINYLDQETRVKYAPWQAIAYKEIKKDKLLSEQMRLLYVALTRAEQKLYLVGTYKNREKADEEWIKGRTETGRVVPSQIRRRAGKVMNWLGMVLANHKDYELASSGKIEEDHQFIIKFFNDSDLQLNMEDSQLADEFESFKKELKNVELNDQDLQFLNQVFDHKYDYISSTHTTNFQSVSEIKRIFEEPEDGQMAKIDISDLANNKFTSRAVTDDFSVPSYLIQDDEVTNAEIGQATHLLLQSVDFSNEINSDSINQLRDDLVSNGTLLEKVANKIDIESIISLFQTDFGQEIKEHASFLKREQAFSLLMDADEVFIDMENSGDSILIHGIIDGYYREGESLVLFDYKTDRVQYLGSQAESELIERYNGQLTLYRKALEAITGMEVSKTILFSLDLNKAIEI